MAENHAITVRLTNEKSQLLGLLSEEYQRSKNFLINEALEKYLEDEIFHLQELQKSMKQADNGQVIAHEQARAEIEQLIGQ